MLKPLLPRVPGSRPTKAPVKPKPKSAPKPKK